MGWTINTSNVVAEESIWLAAGRAFKAYRLTIVGSSIASGSSTELSIALATYAPDIAAAGWGWVHQCEWACDATAVSAAPVLGVVTAPAAALDPYALSFGTAARDGAGLSALPRLFRPAGGSLYLRPNLNTTGAFRMDVLLSQFRGDS